MPKEPWVRADPIVTDFLKLFYTDPAEDLLREAFRLRERPFSILRGRRSQWEIECWVEEWGVFVRDILIGIIGSISCGT